MTTQLQSSVARIKTSAIKSTVVAAMLAVSALAFSAQAAVTTISGTLGFHNDVVQLDFSLSNPATNLRIWSDSWSSGLNFDPAAALWVQAGVDFTRIAEVDDDDSIEAGQGFFDTGFLLPALAAGNYRLTLVAALNASNGTLLSEGFAYDSETPIPLALWNQPSYDPNANDQKGGFWRLNFDGVDSLNVVAAPSTLWMTLLSLPLLGWVVSRRA